MTTPLSVFDVLSGYRVGVNTKLVNNQNSGITTRINGAVRPGWESDYLVSDVSYPMVLNLTFNLFGNTGAASTGTAHTHPLAGSGAVAGGAYWTIAQNDARGGYVTMTDTYQVDTIEFVGYFASALAGGTLDIELFRENPDLSLNRVAIWSYDTASAPPTTATRWSIPTGGGTLVSRQGERYMVRVCNRSNPARTFNILGYGGGANLGMTQSAFYTTGTTQMNKTSYTTAEAATYSNTSILPWWQLSRQNIPPEDKSFDDNFDRVNLGPQWSAGGAGSTGAPVISGGRLTYNGATDGQQPAYSIYPTASDAMRVDVDLWNVVNPGVTVMICLDRERQSFTALTVGATSAIIQSAVGASLTTRATVSMTSDAARWSIYYEPTPNKYTVLKDDKDIGLTWTDSGNVVPHGLNNRYGGLVMLRSGGVNGGQADNFVLRDWAP